MSEGSGLEDIACRDESVRPLCFLLCRLLLSDGCVLVFCGILIFRFLFCFFDGAPCINSQFAVHGITEPLSGSSKWWLMVRKMKAFCFPFPCSFRIWIQSSRCFKICGELIELVGTSFLASRHAVACERVYIKLTGVFILFGCWSDALTRFASRGE